MAPRSFWRGYWRLSLVTCPVAMLPATSESEKVRFHTLNRETGNRVQAQYVDAETGKPVEDGDQVKGYARAENDYVMLENDELDAAGLESTRTIRGKADLYTRRGLSRRCADGDCSPAR